MYIIKNQDIESNIVGSQKIEFDEENQEIIEEDGILYLYYIYKFYRRFKNVDLNIIIELEIDGELINIERKIPLKLIKDGGIVLGI